MKVKVSAMEVEQGKRALGEALRADFPILDQKVNGHPLVYLDNAATTQKPAQVIETISRFYARDYSNVHRGLHELSNRSTAAFEFARARAASFLGASKSEEIVFTRGTTEAINLVASAWGNTYVRKDDIILLTEMEHHGNLVPWQLLAQRTGARIEWIPVLPNGTGLDFSGLDRLLDGPVKILAFTHVSNTLGVVNPAAELCRKARQRNIVTLVDGAQAAGHRPVDVSEIGCDFYTFSAHKAAGPTGIGCLYGRHELLEAMPPYQGGGEMISRVTFEGSRWAPSPAKFEAGTPDIVGAIGLHAALDYLDRVGRDEIQRHDEALAAYAQNRLQNLDFIRLLGPETGRAGIMTFAMRDVHAHDVVALADSKGVALRGGHHCNQPLLRKLGTPAAARASFYLYNTFEETDRLIDVLLEIRDFFK